MSELVDVPFEADLIIFPTRQLDEQRRVQALGIIRYDDSSKLVNNSDLYSEDIEITRIFRDMHGTLNSVKREKRATVKKFGSGILAGLPYEIIYDRDATRVYPEEFVRHIGREVLDALQSVRSVPFLPRDGIQLHTVISPETIDSLRRQNKKR